MRQAKALFPLLGIPSRYEEWAEDYLSGLVKPRTFGSLISPGDRTNYLILGEPPWTYYLAIEGGILVGMRLAYETEDPSFFAPKDIVGFARTEIGASIANVIPEKWPAYKRDEMLGFLLEGTEVGIVLPAGETWGAKGTNLVIGPEGAYKYKITQKGAGIQLSPVSPGEHSSFSRSFIMPAKDQFPLRAFRGEIQVSHAVLGEGKRAQELFRFSDSSGLFFLNIALEYQPLVPGEYQSALRGEERMLPSLRSRWAALMGRAPVGSLAKDLDDFEAKDPEGGKKLIEYLHSGNKGLLRVLSIFLGYSKVLGPTKLQSAAYRYLGIDEAEEIARAEKEKKERKEGQKWARKARKDAENLKSRGELLHEFIETHSLSPRGKSSLMKTYRYSTGVETSHGHIEALVALGANVSGRAAGGHRLRDLNDTGVNLNKTESMYATWLIKRMGDKHGDFARLVEDYKKAAEEVEPEVLEDGRLEIRGILPTRYPRLSHDEAAAALSQVTVSLSNAWEYNRAKLATLSDDMLEFTSIAPPLRKRQKEIEAQEDAEKGLVLLSSEDLESVVRKALGKSKFYLHSTVLPETIEVRSRSISKVERESVLSALEDLGLDASETKPVGGFWVGRKVTGEVQARVRSYSPWWEMPKTPIEGHEWSWQADLFPGEDLGEPYKTTDKLSKLGKVPAGILKLVADSYSAGVAFVVPSLANSMMTINSLGGITYGEKSIRRAWATLVRDGWVEISAYKKCVAVKVSEKYLSGVVDAEARKEAKRLKELAAIAEDKRLEAIYLGPPTEFPGVSDYTGQAGPVEPLKDLRGLRPFVDPEGVSAKGILWQHEPDGEYPSTIVVTNGHVLVRLGQNIEPPNTEIGEIFLPSEESWRRLSTDNLASERPLDTFFPDYRGLLSGARRTLHHVILWDPGRLAKFFEGAEVGGTAILDRDGRLEYRERSLGINRVTAYEPNSWDTLDTAFTGGRFQNVGFDPGYLRQALALFDPSKAIRVRIPTTPPRDPLILTQEDKEGHEVRWVMIMPKRL